MPKSLLKIIKRIIRLLGIVLILAMIWARFFPVPTTLYMIGEGLRQDGVNYQWISTDELPPVIAASVIAAEDAGFCDHNGVEWAILREVIGDGAHRGASTISQQMVKNWLLWQGESRISRMLRKALEIPLTMFVELVYPKARIMEIYLNIIEYDTGVFGIEAAAQHHFGIGAQALNAQQISLLAAVLPNPKGYSAVPAGEYVAKRARQIRRGANDVMAVGLDDCLGS